MAVPSINGINLANPPVVTPAQMTSENNAAQEASTAYAKISDKGNYEFSATKQPSENTIKEVVSKMNNEMKHNNTRCEFNYHDKVNMVSIKIIDNDTNEVVKEIPPEKTLEMIEKMWELAGILVDEKR